MIKKLFSVFILLCAFKSLCMEERPVPEQMEESQDIQIDKTNNIDYEIFKITSIFKTIEKIVKDKHPSIQSFESLASILHTIYTKLDEFNLEGLEPAATLFAILFKTETQMGSSELVAQKEINFRDFKTKSMKKQILKIYEICRLIINGYNSKSDEKLLEARELLLKNELLENTTDCILNYLYLPLIKAFAQIGLLDKEFIIEALKNTQKYIVGNFLDMGYKNIDRAVVNCFKDALYRTTQHNIAIDYQSLIDIVNQNQNEQNKENIVYLKFYLRKLETTDKIIQMYS